LLGELLPLPLAGEGRVLEPPGEASLGGGHAGLRQLPARFALVQVESVLAEDRLELEELPSSSTPELSAASLGAGSWSDRIDKWRALTVRR